MSRWWRAHASALDDPKVQRLPGETFKAWFNLLCIACLRDGILPPVSDIAFALRRSEAATTKLIEDLQGAGLIDQTADGLTPHNWNGRQYKSDVSTERVKQHRERRRNVSVTPSESEADTETESEAEIIRAFALFNDATKRTNWPAAQKLDDRRKRRLRDRLAEVGGIDGFAMVLAKAEGSEFLTVKWPNFNLDWMLKPENFTKLREGNYDNKGQGGARAQTATDDTDQWRARLRTYTPGSFWSPMWGPKPGESGCFVPSNILAEFPGALPQ